MHLRWTALIITQTRKTKRFVTALRRLKTQFVGGIPTREIARRIGMSASTVRATLARFPAARLSWPQPETMTDEALFAHAGTKQAIVVRSRATGHLGRPDGARARQHCDRDRDAGVATVKK
jgi:hypothetical protein